MRSVGVIGRPAGCGGYWWTPPPTRSTGYNIDASQPMPVLELMTSSGLGSLLGMRHALEPDHLAAVTTLVTGERNSIQGRPARRLLGTRSHLRSDRRRQRSSSCCAPRCRRASPSVFEFCVRADADRARRSCHRSRDEAGRAAGPARVASARRTRSHVRTKARAGARRIIGTWTLARRPPARAARSTGWPAERRAHGARAGDAADHARRG